MQVRQVKKLPRDPGSAAWHKLLGEVPSYPPLAQDIHVDWLVIGGGFAGLSAARRLCQVRNGDKVCVIEAGRFGEGPAGRNSGFMIDLPHELSSGEYAAGLDTDKKQIKLNRHAIDFALSAARAYHMADEAVDPCGRINGAVDADGQHHNTSYAAHLSALGEAFETLDAAQMKDITGSDFYTGGLYMPGAVLLQPAMYITELAKGLAAEYSAMLTLYEQTPALSFVQEKSKWVVKTPKGTITADKIILCVNGHAESFGYYTGRLMHVFTYASMTEALDPEQIKALGGQSRWGITPSAPMGSTVRRISGVGGDRILIRNRWSYDPSMEVSEARVARYGADQDKGFLRRFAQLANVKMEYRWSGRLCLSRNSVPAFGMVEENIYSACCQNGLGTAKGTLAGIAAVDLATRSNSPVLQDLQSYDEPVKLPPKPIAWLGANAVLRWREWRSASEL